MELRSVSSGNTTACSGETPSNRSRVGGSSAANSRTVIWLRLPSKKGPPNPSASPARVMGSPNSINGDGVSYPSFSLLSSAAGMGWLSLSLRKRVLKIEDIKIQKNEDRDKLLRLRFIVARSSRNPNLRRILILVNVNKISKSIDNRVFGFTATAKACQSKATIPQNRPVKKKTFNIRRRKESKPLMFPKLKLAGVRYGR